MLVNEILSCIFAVEIPNSGMSASKLLISRGFLCGFAGRDTTTEKAKPCSRG